MVCNKKLFEYHFNIKYCSLRVFHFRDEFPLLGHRLGLNTFSLHHELVFMLIYANAIQSIVLNLLIL